MSTPRSYCELEIDLQRLPSGEEGPIYQAEMRFSDSGADGGSGDEGEKPRAKAQIPLNLDELLELRTDTKAYSKALTVQLFKEADLRTLYARAKTVAETQDSALRIRLRIDPNAIELHAVRWELLCDPESKGFITTSENTPFSRFMVSNDWRPVKLRPKSDLRTLIALSNPSNLARFQLAEVDIDGEIGRASKNLEGTTISVRGKEESLTLECLVDALREGVDILYLVCHGALIKGTPRLYLQKENGEVFGASGLDLAGRIAELKAPPRLVVLASCQSGGTEGGVTSDGQASAESSLAPRLAEAGVPAIVAMQGKISMETVEKIMPVFFTELLKDGQIDRAMAVARGMVRERHDSWMPALYLRLKRGKIWYVPGFGGGEDEFSKWRSICGSVRQGQFIPVLGPDVSEHVCGTEQETADRLSEAHGFPLHRHQRYDLAKVTQFLSVDESRKFARDEVIKQQRRQLLERYPDLAGSKLPFPKLLDAVVEKRREEENEPYRVLADLPASIYVNASYDPLLMKFLKFADQKPKPLLCNWRPTRDNHPQEPTFEGDPEAGSPIVYHVFGVLGKPDSVVLTEDDFFDYLIASSEYKLIPTVVRGTITHSSLLFLGFGLDSWSFRVLFRMIMTLGGSHQLRDYAHVGVQVDPEEHSLLDAARARKYLEGYFGTGGDSPAISIYWGTASDFLGELKKQLAGTAEEDEPEVEEGEEDDWF